MTARQKVLSVVRWPVVAVAVGVAIVLAIREQRRIERALRGGRR